MRTLLAFVAFAALSTSVAMAGQVPLGLKLAMANFNAAKSYHMSFAGGGTDVEIDVVKPNRSHSFVNGKMELIQIGPMSYTRFNGHWIKASQQGDDLANIGKDVADTKLDDPSVKITDLGMTAAGGRIYHRYKMVTSEHSGDVAIIDVGVDNEIYRITASGANNGAVLFSRYNAPIIISAPI